MVLVLHWLLSQLIQMANPNAFEKKSTIPHKQAFIGDSPIYSLSKPSLDSEKPIDQTSKDNKLSNEKDESFDDAASFESNELVNESSNDKSDIASDSANKILVSQSDVDLNVSSLQEQNDELPQENDIFDQKSFTSQENCTKSTEEFNRTTDSGRTPSMDLETRSLGANAGNQIYFYCDLVNVNKGGRHCSCLH